MSSIASLLLARGGRQGAEADGPAAELVNDRTEHPAIDLVEPPLVHFQQLQRVERDLGGDPGRRRAPRRSPGAAAGAGWLRAASRRERRAISSIAGPSMGTPRIPAERRAISRMSSSV